MSPATPNLEGHTHRPPSAPGAVHQRQPANAHLDVGEFWREHDRALSQHAPTSQGAALSHDLYRGMPAWFNAYYAHFQRRAVLGLLRHCHLAPGARVLDLGCGTGRWSGLMLARGLQPMGVDMGEQALQYAMKAWPGAAFSCGALPRLCFADDIFELAISVTVLQHVPHAQQPEALRAIHRVLKPGGYVLMCETVDVQDPSPYIFGNRGERWLELCRQAGFQPIARSACEYVPHVKLFHRLRRLWPKSLPGGPVQADVLWAARLLRTRVLLALPVRMIMVASYPLEYLAAQLFPPQWARLACMLFQKA